MLEFKDGAVEIIFGKAFEKLTDAQRAQVADVQRQMTSGQFYAFTGPLYDQKDTLRIAAGERLSPKDALHMDWFVKGVVTSQPGR